MNACLCHALLQGWIIEQHQVLLVASSEAVAAAGAGMPAGTLLWADVASQLQVCLGWVGSL